MRSTAGRLTGRTVTITGAASGIGRALAQRLSAAGCPVALADVDYDGLRQIAATLTGEVMTRRLDVSDAADHARWAEEVGAWLPAPLGAVINNAGVALSAAALNEHQEDDGWLHEINFHGVQNGTRAFLPRLLEQRAGAIVNVSSVYGLAGVPHQTAYCAAKFAVRGYTEALRAELHGTGVRAVTVHPGGVSTSIARNARFRADPTGRGRDHAELVAEFEAMTRTTPDEAAAIIHRGLERGRPRILVGPDARVFDLLTRLTPSHYHALIRPLMTLAGGRRGTVQNVTEYAKRHR